MKHVLPIGLGVLIVLFFGGLLLFPLTYWPSPGPKPVPIDPTTCSLAVRRVIQEYNLTPIYRCEDTPYALGEGTVHFIYVGWGLVIGFDYWQYDHQYALVTENGTVFPFFRAPETGGYLAMACEERDGKACWQNPLVGGVVDYTFRQPAFTKAIAFKDGTPAWNLTVRRIEGFSGGCASTCTVEGNIIVSWAGELDSKSCYSLLQSRVDGERILSCDSAYSNTWQTSSRHLTVADFSGLRTTFGAFEKCDFGDSYCRMQLAIARDDPELCEQPETYYRDWCFSELAMRHQDPRLCERVRNVERFAAMSRSACFLNLVKVTHDRTVCERFETGLSKDDCDYWVRYRP